MLDVIDIFIYTAVFFSLALATNILVSAMTGKLACCSNLLVSQRQLTVWRIKRIESTDDEKNQTFAIVTDYL
jgi:hypothetical protein